MNLVICTSIGVVCIAIAAAAFIGLLYVVVTSADWFGRKCPVPAWFGNVLTNAFVIAFFAAMAGALLFLGHDIGCKVIHLTMRH